MPLYLLLHKTIGRLTLKKVALQKSLGLLKTVLKRDSKMKLMSQISAVSMLISLSSCLFSYTITPQPNPAESSTSLSFEESMYHWSRIFAEIMHLTHQKHYKADNLENAMVQALNNFLVCLDPHSSFLDKKTYQSIIEATSGEFFGVGIILDGTRQPKEKYLLIIDTISQGPADTAGVKSLDKIIEIDGQPIEGLSTEEAMAKLRGERTTKVHIKVLREGQPDLLSFDITRDAIKEQSSACFYLPDQNIYYLSLTTFSENSIKQIQALLEKSKHKKAKALILDLRNNSGGLLTSAIDIAGLFLKKGSIVVTTKNKEHKVTETYKTTREPVADMNLPIFILINGYTASSAEILAGSLKQHSEASANKGEKRAQVPLVFIVGSTSFGKGSVQEVIPVSNNCAVKMTTSLYYLFGDISIQGVGIDPDFKIERQFPATEQISWFTKFYGKESALANYIKLDNSPSNQKSEKESKQEKEKTWAERTKKLLNEDNQVRGTITLINIFHHARSHTPTLVQTRKKAIEYLSTLYITNKDLTFVEVTI